MNELILLEDLGMIYPKEKSKNKRRYGLYKCFCGNEFKADMSKIKNKHTKSCGCYRIKKIKEIAISHGFSSHRLYHIWDGMIQRCDNYKSTSYKNYGARGITVCERWKDIHNFIEDMYPTFEDGLTLDRIDVNGNYEPNNCRWINSTIQNRNTRILQKNNKTGFRGVSLPKGYRTYRSIIVINKKNIHLGCFNTALEAAYAYDKYVIDNNLEHTTNGLYTKA